MNGAPSTRIITGFFKNHHPVVFIVSILLMLSGAIFSLYIIVEETLGQPIQPSTTITAFDEETIKKIQKLQVSSDDLEQLEFPSSPRSNPFVE